MRSSFKHIFCLVLCASVVVGCSGGASDKGRQKVYKVKGKATFLGSPLIGATVSFSPKEKNKQPAAIGRTNDAGEFTLTTYQSGDGAAAGDYKVTFILVDTGSSKKAPEAAHSPNGGPVQSTHDQAEGTASEGSVLPAKYSDPAQTPESATVDPTKDNTFTFELKQ